MKLTRLHGLSTWPVYQPDRRIDFNGFFLAADATGGAGGILIDPMPLDPVQLAQVTEQGGAGFVIVTNADHLRAGAELADRFQAQLVAPAPDSERFSESIRGRIDAWFGPDEELPAPLAALFDVSWMAGGKSPLEPALYWKAQQAWVFSDLVRSHESGRLRLLPAPKLSDESRAKADVRELLARPAEAILLGDGDSIFNGAREALDALAAELA